MPVDINALEEWTVGDRMLDDMLHGMDPAQARQAEWRRGTLPPGQLGWRKATEICDQAALLAEAARAVPQGRVGRRRRRHRPRRTTADRHRFAGVRRPTRLGDVLQARRTPPAAVMDSVAGVDRSRSGPRLVGDLHRPAQAGHRLRAGRAAPTRRVRRRPAGGSGGDVRRGPPRHRCRCRPRRPTRGRRPSTATAIRSGRRGSGGDPRPLSRRGRRERPTCGRSARAPGCPASSMRASTTTLAGCGCRCCERWTHDRTFRPVWARCPPRGRPRCWRPAQGRARRSRWPVWSRATSPRARRRWTRCC